VAYVLRVDVAKEVKMSIETFGLKSGDRITRFERGIVFRVARGFFLFVAVGAVLVFIAGGIIGARGAAETPIAKAPHPVRPAPRTRLDYMTILKGLEREEEEAKNAVRTVRVGHREKGDSVNATADRSDEVEKARFYRTLKEVQALFPEPTYAWLNQTERVCTTPSSYGCFRYETKITKLGVSGIIEQVLPGTYADAEVFLATLVNVLKDVPVAKRMEYVPHIVRFDRSEAARYERVVQDYEAAVQEIDAKYSAEVEASHAQHAAWKKTGAYGLLGGFFALVVVSLFLAFLAMERHSRALERLTTEIARNIAEKGHVVLSSVQANDTGPADVLKLPA
jgi:hypothetical protein